MIVRPSRERLAEIWRYYQAGIVNTAFGFGLYALLVAAGLHMYMAQAVGHILGIGFNYVTYSRHAFRDTRPAKLRFLLSYAANYVVSFVLLFLTHQIIPSPYLAGIVSIGLTSVVNYFALKHMVFNRPATQ